MNTCAVCETAAKICESNAARYYADAATALRLTESGLCPPIRPVAKHCGEALEDAALAIRQACTHIHVRERLVFDPEAQ